MPYTGRDLVSRSKSCALSGQGKTKAMSSLAFSAFAFFCSSWGIAGTVLVGGRFNTLMLSPPRDFSSKTANAKIVRWRGNVCVVCGVAQDMDPSPQRRGGCLASTMAGSRVKPVLQQSSAIGELPCNVSNKCHVHSTFTCAAPPGGFFQNIINTSAV